MTVRHTAQKTGIEVLADAVPDEYLDLRPYLAGGVEGLRRYMHELTLWLESNGSNAAALSDLLRCLGVDVAACYRVMLTQS
jgi:hypothetical protein